MAGLTPTQSAVLAVLVAKKDVVRYWDAAEIAEDVYGDRKRAGTVARALASPTKAAPYRLVEAKYLPTTTHRGPNLGTYRASWAARRGAAQED